MLEVRGLTKQFKEIRAVDGVSFSVRAGEIYGLLGKNGAGKTTTLRMIATMLRPTAGTAAVCGHDVISDSLAVRANIGVLFGGEAGLYDRLSAKENILYFADLNDVPKEDSRARIERIAAAFELGQHLNRPAGKLSKGTKQKVAFARAIIHDPAVMLFDEPTSGLDVTSIREAHDFILECKNEGKAIVLSSHILDEIEKLCDRVGILDGGVLRGEGTLDELKQTHGAHDLEGVFRALSGGGSQ